VIKSRRMRWAGHVTRTGERRGVDRGLVGRSGGKRPLGRPKPSWEDINTMDFQKVGRGPGGGRRIDLAEDRTVGGNL
jgi:hypothetical protein